MLVFIGRVYFVGFASMKWIKRLIEPYADKDVYGDNLTDLITVVISISIGIGIIIWSL